MNSPTRTPPAMMTVSNVCNLLSISRSTVYALVKAGKLRKIALTPGCVRFARAEVEALAQGEAGKAGPVKG